jgi:hypothetical protein
MSKKPFRTRRLDRTFPGAKPHLGGLNVTNYTEHSLSSEANRFSASQEIPRILGNWKVHYRVHKIPKTVPILDQVQGNVNVS